MNISLIGMPGVGKTYLGSRIADLLDYEFIDSDKLIEEKYSHPEDLIVNQGEDAFLKIEKKTLLSLNLTKNNLLLATGGSVVYNQDIMLYLKEHSKVVYLCDNYENIYWRVSLCLKRGIVGLKKKGGDFKKLYDYRLSLYEQYADVRIDLSVKNSLEAIVDYLKSMIK